MTLSRPDFYFLCNFAHEVQTAIMIKALRKLAKSNPFTTGSAVSASAQKALCNIICELKAFCNAKWQT